MYSAETEMLLEEVQKIIDSPEWHTDWDFVSETNGGDVMWNHVTGEIMFNNKQKYFIRRRLDQKFINLTKTECCKSCGVPLTDEDLAYEGGRKNYCRDCN